MNGSSLWSNWRNEDVIVEIEDPKINDIHPIGGIVHSCRPQGSEAVPVLEIDRLMVLQ
jgi:hypothetical protein